MPPALHFRRDNPGRFLDQKTHLKKKTNPYLPRVPGDTVPCAPLWSQLQQMSPDRGHLNHTV